MSDFSLGSWPDLSEMPPVPAALTFEDVSDLLDSPDLDPSTRALKRPRHDGEDPSAPPPPNAPSPTELPPPSSGPAGGGQERAVPVVAVTVVRPRPRAKRKGLALTQVFSRYRSRAHPAVARTAPKEVAECSTHGRLTDAQVVMHAGRTACVACLRRGDERRARLLECLQAELDACHGALAECPGSAAIAIRPPMGVATVVHKTFLLACAGAPRALEPLDAEACWKGGRDAEVDSHQGVASSLASVAVHAAADAVRELGPGEQADRLIREAAEWVAPDGDLRSPYVECRRNTRLLQLGNVGERSANPIVARMQSVLANAGPYGSAMSDLNREPNVTPLPPRELPAPDLAQWLHGEAEWMKAQVEELKSAAERCPEHNKKSALAAMEQGDRAVRQLQAWARHVQTGAPPAEAAPAARATPTTMII